MNIKIKLKNPKYCDDCPCLHLFDRTLKCVEDYQIKYKNKLVLYRHVIRPKKCIEENGK